MAMGWRLYGVVCVLVLAGAVALSGCRRKTGADGPIRIGAIFSVTGPGAYLGAPEKKTLEMLVEKLNAAGGINGRQIELIVADSGTNTEKALSLAKQMIDEQEVLAIIGPSTSGETAAVMPVCQEGRTPLISCAAAEKITNPLLSYVFKVAPNDSDAVRWIFKTMNQMKVSRVLLLSSTDGFGVAGKAQVEELGPKFGISIVISEQYPKEETDLTDVVTKLKGRDVQAVINWSAVPAQGLVAKNMKQIGLNVPLFQSHGFGNRKNIEMGGEAAEGTLLPCGRILVADVLPDNHPQKAVLMQYKKDYEGKFGEDASMFGGHPHDALLLLTEAIRKAGEPDRQKVRDALENLRGVVGTAGVFNLSPKDHCGLGEDAFEMLVVKDGKFAVYKK